MKRFFTALPALLAPAAGWADGPGSIGGGYYDHPMMWGGYGYGFMGVGMMVLVWAVVIALGYVAVRWLLDRGQSARTPDALGILKERLARGEIDPAEYEARRKALES